MVRLYQTYASTLILLLQSDTGTRDEDDQNSRVPEGPE